MRPLAIDRMGSVRTFDADGRLRVESTPISKANICSYWGREIPKADELGLDLEKTYHLLRDPVELERGAASFNGIPVLDDHPTFPARVTADNPQKEIVVGATMDAASFEAPYLKNGLVVWDGALIDKIKSGEQRELSCGYDYTPDMTPGTYQGEPYDGRMTEIQGNHIALVSTGRAGPDVLVADTQQGAPTMADKDDKPGCDSPDEALKSILGDDCDPKKLEAIKKLFSSAQDSDEDDEDDIPSAQDEDDDTPAQDEEQDDKDNKKPAEDEDDKDDDKDDKKERRSAADSAYVQREVKRHLKIAHDHQRALEQAKGDVRPLVGEVHNLHEAGDVYRYALTSHGMATDGLSEVNMAGLRALVQDRVAHLYPPPQPTLATDSTTLGYIAPRKL